MMLILGEIITPASCLVKLAMINPLPPSLPTQEPSYIFF